MIYHGKSNLYRFQKQCGQERTSRLCTDHKKMHHVPIKLPTKQDSSKSVLSMPGMWLCSLFNFYVGLKTTRKTEHSVTGATKHVKTIANPDPSNVHVCDQVRSFKTKNVALDFFFF